MYQAPEVVPHTPLPVLTTPTSVSLTAVAPDIGTLDIKLILLEAFEECGLTPTENRYNTTVWLVVFSKVFKRTPLSNHDPLWEKLFAHDGFGALKEVQTL